LRVTSIRSCPFPSPRPPPGAARPKITARLRAWQGPSPPGRG